MCIECDLNRAHRVFLCVNDRKVWKSSGPWESSHCPKCGQPGRNMGWRWRAPRLSNKKAWSRIANGDYLWERSKTFVGQPTWSGDKINLAKKKAKGLGRYVPLKYRKTV